MYGVQSVEGRREGRGERGEGRGERGEGRGERGEGRGERGEGRGERGEGRGERGEGRGERGEGRVVTRVFERRVKLTYVKCNEDIDYDEYHHRYDDLERQRNN